MPKMREKSHGCDEQGRVIAYFGSTVSVETAEAGVVTCHWRRNQCLPVVGDYVGFTREATGEGGIIHEILPRKTVLMRAQGRTAMKPIAANLDRLVIVMVPPPVFSQALVDSYAVAAELLGIQPVLVLNKSDLMPAADRLAFESVLSVYRGVPYPVLFTSTHTGEGMAELEGLLAHHTAALVGPSGVGKSSLIQCLSKEESIRVGDVTEKGIGKHTTTATRLYTLADGGALIDSPGVREFQLWPVTKDEVLRGFPEFKSHLIGCQFRDCSHAIEPGCAVQAALADGKISAHRYKTFQTLMQQAHKKKP
jgi:ribosome biogenesis GTPase